MSTTSKYLKVGHLAWIIFTKTSVLPLGVCSSHFPYGIHPDQRVKTKRMWRQTQE